MTHFFNFFGRHVPAVFPTHCRALKTAKGLALQKREPLWVFAETAFSGSFRRF